MSAAASAAARNRPCRARYQAALWPVKRLASAVAIEAEYTMTRPKAASISAAHASDRSYSALGALRAKTYVRLTPAAPALRPRTPRRGACSRETYQSWRKPAKAAPRPRAAPGGRHAAPRPAGNRNALRELLSR